MPNAWDRFEEKTPWSMLVHHFFTVLTFFAMVGGKLLFVLIFGVIAVMAAYWNTDTEEEGNG